MVYVYLVIGVAALLVNLYFIRRLIRVRKFKNEYPIIYLDMRTWEDRQSKRLEDYKQYATHIVRKYQHHNEQLKECEKNSYAWKYYKKLIREETPELERVAKDIKFLLTLKTQYEENKKFYKNYLKLLDKHKQK